MTLQLEHPGRLSLIAEDGCSGGSSASVSQFD